MCHTVWHSMASLRITVRVPKALGALLRHCSRAQGRTPSDLVRVALKAYLVGRDSRRSAYTLAEEAGLIGCVRRAPKDLSTNLCHFEAIGKNK